ncbi:hypothetical protein B0H19DRAFT_1198433 [Mycena capillaripes]|nr:hypothetical protein B0H19DRAFT_1198433 [Mycena capillaripes]
MPPRKKAKRGKGKELAFTPSPNGFPALPLDILFEIFSLAHPLDLLRLTRTTKAFRRFLLNRANVGIWRAAFSALHEDGLPECPPYTCEPAWARLLFEKACHICSTTLRDDPNLDPVWWEFSARYCASCVSNQVSKTVSKKLKRLDPKRDWNSILPSVPRNRYPGDSSCYYLVSHQTQLIDELMKTENTQARAAVVQKRLEETLLINEHSKSWRNWGRKQIENRRNEAASRQEEKRRKEKATEEARVQAIVAKLAALGWSDEPWMLAGNLASQVRRYPSVVVPRALTPRAYRELEPALLSQLNADKHAYIVRNRLVVFRGAFPRLITKQELDNLALDIPPYPYDVALTPTVRELLDEAGDASVDELELVTKLQPMMPTILQTWIADSIAQIGAHAHGALNLGDKDESNDSNSEALDPLSMAIAFVGCPRKCGAAGHIPSLLKHSCTGPDRLDWLLTPLYGFLVKTTPDPYQAVAQSVFYGQKRFTPTILDFKSRLGAVEGVVKALGRDPKTTTIQDMAAERRLLSCTTCTAKAKDPRDRSKPNIAPNPMDWLAAMHHSLKSHLTERDLNIEWELSGKTGNSDALA